MPRPHNDVFSDFSKKPEVKPEPLPEHYPPIPFEDVPCAYTLSSKNFSRCIQQPP